MDNWGGPGERVDIWMVRFAGEMSDLYWGLTADSAAQTKKALDQELKVHTTYLTCSMSIYGPDTFIWIYMEAR